MHCVAKLIFSVGVNENDRVHSFVVVVDSRFQVATWKTTGPRFLSAPRMSHPFLSPLPIKIKYLEGQV